MRDGIKRWLDDLGTVLMVVAGAGVVFRLFVSPRLSPAAQPVETVKGLSLAADQVRHVLGTQGVVLVEFADFECPFCARHAATTGVALEDQLVKSGQMQMAFVNFPLPMHLNAQKAAEAAECAADQGHFWEMRQKLFQGQSDLDESHLVKYAEAIGLDRVPFTQCLESDGAAAKVRADADTGRRLGVSSTPSFFVGRRQASGEVQLVKRINGAVPLDVFKTAITDLSAQAFGNWGQLSWLQSPGEDVFGREHR